MNKPTRRIFSSLPACFLLLWVVSSTGLYADISVSITFANSPGGTLTNPHFVIDSDAENSNPAYDRDAIPASVDVAFEWEGGAGEESASYRASVRLIGPDGEPVEFAHGSTTRVSAFHSVTMSNANPNETHTFEIALAPGEDLGAGPGFELQYTIDRQEFFIGPGGFPIFFNAPVTDPETSDPFVIVHFTDDPGVPGARNIRGYLTGDPVWVKTHAVRTGTTTIARSFRVSVPYRQWRYDLDGVSENTELRFTVEMTDDLGNPVPLENGGVDAVSFTRSAFNAGTPETPAMGWGTRTINFAPEEQLDARNRTYSVRVRFEHLEVPGDGIYQDNGTFGESSAQQLLDFNGKMLFGSGGNQIEGEFSAISNQPSPGVSGPDFVTTTLNVTSGGFPAFPDYSFGDGTPLGVRLMTNGDAVVTTGSQPVMAAGGGDVEADFNGVRVFYPGAIIGSDGAVADDVLVRLPQGLSVTPNREGSGGRYLPELPVPGPRQLDGEFRHEGTLMRSMPSDAWVFDESRTLQYQVGHFTLTQGGEISWDAPQAEWVHAGAWELLETNFDMKLYDRPEMAVRMSNEGYLRHAALDGAAGGQVVFDAASDGTARCLRADILLGESIAVSEFSTHFPRAVVVPYTQGQLEIRDGIVTDGSEIEVTAPLLLTYDGSCPDDECGPEGAEAKADFEMTLAGNTLRFTSDGGMFAEFTNAPDQIRWGLRGTGDATHRTDEFIEGAFLASGNQLYDRDNPLAADGPLQDVAGDTGPSVILLAGHDEADHNTPIYPDTSGYADGVGAWPGATFTVTSAGTVGASILADMDSEYPYVLQKEVSKYYVRPSGLSGRHVATEDGFDPGVDMYGYEFRLSRFQLTFLSNENEMSWINGRVVVPYPSSFSQGFTELMLSCTGALEGAQIDPDDAGPKPLEYWNGSFSPLTMRFAPEADADCYANRFLTIGLLSGAANIETPLAGVLGFLPTGNIAQLGTNIENVDSRLGLPATVPMAGPGEETYALNPVSKLYFNNHDTPGRPETGFVSFAATCNVPFFEDLRVHVMTSARAGVPAPIHLASGWTQADETFFSNNKFDASHRGFPPSFPVDDYQRPAEETPFVVVARQSIFGLVPLEYPLRWNESARFFDSWEPEHDDLFVVHVEHQIDYLSADNAEITFGAQYDGLPQVNLVSSAYDIVDEQLGAARAITEAAQVQVTETLNSGVDELGNLVNDTMENVLEQAIDELEQQIIDPIYSAVISSYQAAVAADQNYIQWVDDSADGLKAQFNEYFDTSVGAGAGTVKGYLQQLANATGQASSLVTSVDDAVVQAILAIDSVAGEIELFKNAAGELEVGYELPPADVEETIPGIIALVPGDDGPVREIVQNLVEELIRELAPPDLAAVINPLLDDASSQLNEKLRELTERADPTLDRITEVLMEARGFLVDVRAKLADANEILGDFQDIIDNANDEIDSIVASMRTTAENFIDNIAASAGSPFTEPLGEIGSLIDEFDKDEFVELLRAELRDRLLQTEFIQQIQYVLRQYISEIDIAVRSAIDSAFAEVNRICKQLIRDALGPIDDTINGLVGDINEVVGAGSLDGYAHIQGDTLRRLRIDAEVELKVPDELTLQAYFEMLCYDSSTSTGSDGKSSCLVEGEKVVEVRIGAYDVPLDWVSPDLRADFGVWFAMRTEPEVRPHGLGGHLNRTDGILEFSGFTITDFAASVAVGAQENYLAASATVIVSDYEAAGGIFFGRTCSIEPLELVDPDAASLLGDPPFTGAYVYGEVWLPISEMLSGVPATCLFRISAGVGAGAFYFAEGPVYGGRMLLGVCGEALCIVSIRGEVSLVGVMSGGDLRFSGRGTIKGKAGKCPFCKKFRKSAKVTYEDGAWSVD